MATQHATRNHATRNTQHATTQPRYHATTSVGSIFLLLFVFVSDCLSDDTTSKNESKTHGPTATENWVSTPVVFSSEKANGSQEVKVTNVIPGKRCRITLPLQNPEAVSLNFNRVVLSCGCMAIHDFQSSFDAKSTRELLMDVTLEDSPGVLRKEIRFEEAGGDFWSIVLSCYPLKVFQDTLLVFDVKNPSGSIEGEVALKFTEEFKSSLYYESDDESITVSSGGNLIEALSHSILPDGSGLQVAFSIDAAKLGIKPGVIESINVATARLSTSVGVEFRNQNSVRVSPSSCNWLRLKNGSQRFMIFTEGSFDELEWFIADESKLRIKLNVTLMQQFRRGVVVSVDLPEDAKQLDFTKILIVKKDVNAGILSEMPLIK